MASVRLHGSEVYEEDLPPVCMCCGARARFYPKKNFLWHPPWVICLLPFGLLPFAVVASILTKRMNVWAPMCNTHRNHWAWRTALMWIGLCVFVVLGFIALVLAVNQQPGQQNPAFGLVCAGLGILLLAFLITLAIVHYIAIRPTEITDSTITLTNVCDEFIIALEEEEEEEERRSRERRRRPPRPARDNFDDEDNDDRIRSRRR